MAEGRTKHEIEAETDAREGLNVKEREMDGDSRADATDAMLDEYEE